MLAARQGLRVVQVDAWRSPSAALADEWVAIAPGGEGPLALALAHVVVREQQAPDGDDVRARARAASRRSGPRRARASSRSGSRRSPASLVGQRADRRDRRRRPRRRPARARRRAGDRAPERRPGQRGPRRRLRPAPPAARGRRRCRRHRADRPRGRARRLGGRRSSSTRPTTAAPCRGPLLAPHAREGRRRGEPLAVRRRARPRGATSSSRRPRRSRRWDEVLPTADASVASYAVSAPRAAGARRARRTRSRSCSAWPPPSGWRSRAATHEERLRARAAAIHAARPGPARRPRDRRGYADEAAADAARRSGRPSWPAAAGSTSRSGLDAAGGPARRCRRRLRSSAGAGRKPRRAASRLVAFAARGTAGDDARLAAPHQALPGVGPAALGRATAAVSPDDGRAPRPRRRPAASRIESAAGGVRAELRIDPALPPGRIALAAGPDRGALHPGTSTRRRGALAAGRGRGRRHLA